MFKNTTILLSAVICLLPFCAPAQDAPSLEDALKALPQYKLGDSRLPLSAVESAVLKAGNDAAAKAAIEAALLPILIGESSLEAKRFIGRQLCVVGSAASTQALTPFLAKKESADFAAWALAVIPDAEAGEALREALAALPDAHKPPVIEALGRRGEAASVAVLKPLLAHADAAVALLSVRALAKIANPEACAFLTTQRKTAPYLKAALEDACVQCAEAMADRGEQQEALAAYEALMAPEEAGHVRAAALAGLVAVEPEAAFTRVSAALDDTDAMVAGAALSFVRSLPGEALTNSFAALLPSLEGAKKVGLIAALEDRGDPIAGKAVLAAAAKNEEKAVRTAAVLALGVLGDNQAAMALLDIAAHEKGMLPREARASLARLSGSEINGLLMEVVAGDDPAMQVQAARALASRHAKESRPLLAEYAMDEDEKVRAECLKSLRVLGDAEDLPRLFALLPKALDDTHRETIEQTVVAAAQRITDPEARIQPVLAQWEAVSDNTMRVSLLRIFGKLPCDASFKAIQGAMSSEDQWVRKAALSQLAWWQNEQALDDLWAVVQEPRNAEERDLAMEGYLRSLRAAKNCSVKERMDRYQKAMPLLKSADEKKTILAGVSDAPCETGLKIAMACRDDDAVKAEADFAILKIAKSLSGAYPELARAAVEPFLAAEVEEGVRKQAQAVIDAMAKFEDYIVAWEVSGPYTEEGKTGYLLFDVVFPPEEDKAVWQIMPMAIRPDHPAWLVDLATAFGGNERVVYLKTTLDSPEAKEALLELGTNDGFKLWLNGELIQSFRNGRPLTPGQDKLPLSLKAGANTLLLAVYQQGGDWAACARLRTPDRQAIPEVTVSVSP